MIQVKCLKCDKEFEAQRSSAKFCSAKCRVEFNRAVGVEPEPPKVEDTPKEAAKPEKKKVVPPSPKPKKETSDRKILNPEAPKTKQMLEPLEGTPAYFLRYGAFHKKDISK